MQKNKSSSKAPTTASNAMTRQQRRHPREQQQRMVPPTIMTDDIAEIAGNTTNAVPSAIDPVSRQRFGENGIQYVRPKRDNPPVPGQMWWVMSYVTPSGANGMRCRDIVVKNSGSFATVEEAEKRAEYIRNQEPRITTHVVTMYEMLTVPIPIDIDQGLRKHYMDARLDAIMINQHKQVTQARKEMEIRINSEKQKALANMRRTMNDPNYQFPEAPEAARKKAELLTEARVTKPAKYQAQTIVETFMDTMKKFEGKPVDETFLTAVMENLGQAKHDEDASANALREQNEREGLQNIAATHAPAVADGLISPGMLLASTTSTDSSTETNEAVPEYI